jgi:subtilisin family serine protease
VSCTGQNAVGADPIQVLIIGNPADAPGKSAPETVSISIGLRNGTPPPGRIKFILNGNGAPTDINRFESLYGTIQGHPSAAGAAAVGAIFWAQTSTCGVRFPKVELYSSTGGDPIMFDTAGARLSRFVLRQKPDFVAPDGANDTFLGFTLASADVKVSSTVFGCQNLGEVPNFFGTSAAAPHAAGAAALLWQANPASSPAQLIGALQKTAQSLSITGYPDDLSGYGFIQVDAALASLTAPPPALSIAPTAVTAGDKVTLSWSSLGSGCFASGSWSGAKAASGSETDTATSAGTNTYTLKCASAGGLASSSVTLTVNAKSGGGGSLDPFTLLVILGSFGLARRSRKT